MKSTEKNVGLFLSIIIPAHNAGLYISDCLDSCLNQNLNANYEIICVDDYSTDNTRDIIRSYGSYNSNIICVFLEENIGVSGARNVGLLHARGDYVWFVDADDYIERNILGHFYEIYLTERYDELVFKLSFFEEKEIKYIEKAVYYLGSCCVRLFKRVLLQQYNLLFNESIAYGEDELLVFLYELNELKIIKSDCLAYYYRKNNSSAMHSINTEVYVNSMISSCKSLNDILKKNTDLSFNQQVRILSFIVNRINCALDRIAILPLFSTNTYIQMLSDNGLYPLILPTEDYLVEIKNYYKCTSHYYKRIRREYLIENKIKQRISHPISSFKHLFEKCISRVLNSKKKKD